MKKLRIIVLVFSLFFLFAPLAFAENFEEIYTEQFKLSGAAEIEKAVPKESKEMLEKMGIDAENPAGMLNFDLSKILISIVQTVKEKVSFPFGSFLSITAIMLLFVLVQSIYPAFRNKEMSRVLNLVSSLCISICIINPAVKTISLVSLVIKSACNFIFCYVPVMSTIMIASGQSICAASYHTFIIFAGQIISRLSEDFLMPLLNVLLGLCVVCSISPHLKLGEICKMVMKTLKNVLEFFSVVFTSILTLQNLVANSGDSLKSSLAKCVLGQCVPIVGGMVSDAYSTVQGSIRLLKSGVGAFGVFAGAVVFLPAFAQCGLWIIFLNFSKCIGDILELKNISSLIKSVVSVMSTVMAILVFSFVILVVSCVVMLVIGGK